MAENKKKFLLDENLGKLAKWLRMLGYDAAVYKSISIEKKISLCKKERRVFLTRSKKIVRRKEKFSRILIKTEKYDEQLREIIHLIEFDNEMLSSRCLECNYKLQELQVEKIKDIIPENVKHNFSNFKICRKCGKIFWKGSHYTAMKSKLKNLLTT
ncbi:MAG: Mut7-C RNAse domain-containing protein [Candidatus Cloacimonetes bacterium]|nr:Mut7-C RNAse domain-containing protein [Candidatus Cloacimonadota bacterium]